MLKQTMLLKVHCQIRKKKGKLTCEINPSEKPSIKNKHLTKTKEQP